MKPSEVIHRFWNGMLLVGFSLFIISCSNQLPHEGKVVFTQVPVQSVSNEQLKINDFKYASGMKIALRDLGGSDETIEILTNDFLSARAPEISYDGKSVIFSGQKAEGDPWQIWKLDFEKELMSPITQSDKNCTDPLFLPDGRIAYSKLIVGEKSLSYHALFSCYSDGSDEQRMTFQPHEDVSANMLNDGRLLVSSKQVYPDEGALKFLAVHPDGTKAELFYQTIPSAKSISKAWESMDKKVFFAESGQLVSIDFNRPLNSRKLLSDAEREIYLSVFPIDNQQLLASILKQGERTCGLAVYDVSDPKTTILSFNDSEYHTLEPVLVKPRLVPKKLPSTVNMERESGYFMCMDVNRSDRVAEGTASKVQVLGVDNILGEAEVEEDGSFYLEIGADQPIRFQSLNEAGDVIGETSSWMWLRPNERRGCVGCHEDREMAPDNVVPLAIEKSPVAMINN